MAWGHSAHVQRTTYQPNLTLLEDHFFFSFDEKRLGNTCRSLMQIFHSALLAFLPERTLQSKAVNQTEH